MTSTAEIQDRLNPAHLSTEAIKDDLKAQDESTEEVKDEKIANNPRAQEKYTFQLKYKDARGHTWTGEFTSKILNQQERAAASIMQARLAGTVPYESLNPLARELALIRAHLAYSLVTVEDTGPKWAVKLDDILDPGVLQALYEEVASHEHFFLGWGEFAGKSSA